MINLDCRKAKNKDAKKDKGGKKQDDKNAVAVEIEDPEDIEFVKGKIKPK